MKKILQYLNPIAHLGDARYSFVFPFLANILLCIFSEAFAYAIMKNQNAVGTYIIFLNVAFIIYFAFRDGVKGGFTSALLAILYYIYIVITRHYAGVQLQTGLDTIFILAILYFLLAAIIGWLKQTIDILIERELNEKIRLRTILDQLAAGVIITDHNGKVTQANKQLEKILGIKIPVGFIMGEDMSPLQGIQNDIPVDTTQSPLYQSLKTGRPIFDKEFAFTRKDGKTVFVQVNASVIRNAKKQVIAAASIITDITAQKELEKQKDDFLSMASHELKTPITSLKMFIDLQQRQLQKRGIKKAQYFNDRIKDQANQLQELTNDLLDVSRIQTGKLHFAIEKFDIADIVRDTVEGLQGTTQNHKIIKKILDSCIVKGDRYRIYQVFVNLLTNAIKYSKKGKNIIVKMKIKGKFVVISVQDFGIGINVEEQKNIFNKFYQVADSKEKTFPGLGLGLFISKEIIERHNGKIWVESVKGNGSTFYFSLPIRESNKIESFAS